MKKTDEKNHLEAFDIFYLVSIVCSIAAGILLFVWLALGKTSPVVNWIFVVVGALWTFWSYFDYHYSDEKQELGVPSVAKLNIISGLFFCLSGGFILFVEGLIK